MTLGEFRAATAGTPDSAEIRVFVTDMEYGRYPVFVEGPILATPEAVTVELEPV